jgi:outer membrane murein-binding lipoprotein Lpp
MRRALRVAEPCSESWEGMVGSDGRRFCGCCEKHVHSLSDLTAAEAERLIASAPPHSLCVRFEEEADGTIRFKREEAESPRPRAHPVVHAAAVASLLVAGCGRADPAEPLEAQALPQAAKTAEAEAEVKANANANAALPSPSGGPALTDPDAGAACSDPKGAPSGLGAASKLFPKKDPPPARVTMGCLCEPGDALCSCL